MKAQIEEMALAICKSRMVCNTDSCRKCFQHERCLYQEIADALYKIGYRKQREKYLVKESGDIVPLTPAYNDHLEYISDILTDYDEMGFVPTTAVPDPEEYAIKWREKITKAIVELSKQSEGVTDTNVGSKSEWISVTERLPESGASVLGYSEIVGDIRCYDICKGRCDSTLQWWSETGWATVDDLLVTHWMLLPEPPEKKGGVE